MPVWLVSLIIHLLMLLMLALITTKSGSIGSIVLTISQDGGNVANELTEFSIDTIELDGVSQELPVDLDLSLEPDRIESSIRIASLDPPIDPLAPLFDGPLLSGAVTKLSVLPSNMFAGRTGAMKQRLLKQAGGTKTTEDAVSLGLKWIQRQQLGDGSWSLRGPYADGGRNENKVSATSMAMLAFMGAGSTHRGGQYKKELWQAVRWLVKQQGRDGFMAGQAIDHEKMYAQAQATIALCELYAMTGDSWIRPFAQASCDFAVAAQSPQGGWRYRPRFDSDTSVTGWFVMGLQSGQVAGLEVDPYVWHRVAGYLDSVSASRVNDYYASGFSYMVGDAASPSMTAEGLLCRQYMGSDRNLPGMREGLGAIVANHPISYREPDVYYWYYATQSLHHFGGPLWKQWNDRLKVEVPAQQITRGPERGSWSPQNDAWGRHAGRLYTTCFSLYCLEVYYRHMPLYNPDDEV
ncbi:hypothetical protein K227x_60240 [Rubripirellula lacrimiformis]|uniref:Squalene cyclase C-terminal domain-containing protein n=2 Tax=Rubripirellula lacrimiformis TaxID=1930273 RepID=A0A517NKF1_9BACT|nr:hypothetical protein K227x_60240 [Rubripirellula lacrimiformis]